MSVYKIVGRFRSKENRRPWQSGKAGTQAAKRIYTNQADYEKYAPELIRRWLNSCNYDVEVYRQGLDKWVLIDSKYITM